MALYVYTCKLILKAFKSRIVLIFKIPPNFTYCEHKKIRQHSLNAYNPIIKTCINKITHMYKHNTQLTPCITKNNDSTVFCY